MRPTIELLRAQETAQGTRVAVAGSRRDPFDFAQQAVVGSFVLISVTFFYAAISRSVSDHFWMDEVLAVTAAREPTLSGVWQAIWSGTDFSPPTYHFLLHGLTNAVGADSRLLWRLPSILSIYGAAVCMYLFLLRSQLSRPAAVLGFSIVLGFDLFDYAIQVREYAMLVFGLAAALLLWSEIGDTRSGKSKAFGLWLVLSACLCIHFYGFIEVAAVGAAELIYSIGRKRIRIAVWVALLLTLPVEAALFPLARHLAMFNNGDNIALSYYAKPSLDAFFVATYEVVEGGSAGAAFLLVVLVLVCAALPGGRVEGRAASAQSVRGGVVGSLKLRIVLIALCLLPPTAFAFSVFVTKSFSARYMAVGALIPAIAVPWVLDMLPWRRATTVAIVPLVAAMLVLRAQAPHPIAQAMAVLTKAAPPLPIIVGEGLLYIELMEAVDPGTRAKLVYLTRTAGAVSPDPTNENEVIRLAGLNPEYRVRDEAAFLATHERFYVLSRPHMSTDTTTPSLVAKGLLKNPLDAEHGVLLFLSSAPAQAPQSGGRQ